MKESLHNNNQTLGVQEAAAFLRMSPAALYSKARTGEIPGRKPAKEWCFLRDDLIAYLRSGYSPKIALNLQDSNSWQSKDEERKVSIGLNSQHPMASEYENLLGLPTARKQKNLKDN